MTGGHVMESSTQSSLTPGTNSLHESETPSFSIPTNYEELKNAAIDWQLSNPTQESLVTKYSTKASDIIARDEKKIKEKKVTYWNYFLLSRGNIGCPKECIKHDNLALLTNLYGVLPAMIALIGIGAHQVNLTLSYSASWISFFSTILVYAIRIPIGKRIHKDHIQENEKLTKQKRESVDHYTAIKRYLDYTLHQKQETFCGPKAPLVQLRVALADAMGRSAAFKIGFEADLKKLRKNDPMRETVQRAVTEATSEWERLQETHGKVVTQLGNYQVFFNECSDAINKIDLSLSQEKRLREFGDFKEKMGDLAVDAQKLILSDVIRLFSTVTGLQELLEASLKEIPAATALTADPEHRNGLLEAAALKMMEITIPSVPVIS